MIRYALKCSDNHAFESWFHSAEAYDSLAAAGHVTCPTCGSAEVTKALMAPGVQSGTRGALAAPADSAEEKLAALKRDVEENSEYVGLKFAAEARKIHDGEAPGRAIYGEAKPEDAKALLEDGVPVAPLPFIPARRAN